MFRIALALGLSNLSIREAVSTDSDFLRKSRNHITVRQVSRNTNVIDADSHHQWFQSVLSNDDRVILLGLQEDQVMGVVRFDIKEAEAEVSIYISPEISEHKKPYGLGSEVLIAAEHWLRSERPSVTRISAQVLAENMPSHRLFVKNGYHRVVSHYCKVF